MEEEVSKLIKYIKMTFPCSFLLFFAFQVVLLAAVSRQWSNWKLYVLPSKWKRVKYCEKNNTKCIKQEATSAVCLDQCYNIGSIQQEPSPRFSSCNGLCYYNEHSRSLLCSKNGNDQCVLTQFKPCVVKECLGTWNAWSPIFDNRLDHNCTSKPYIAFTRNCNLPFPVSCSKHGGQVVDFKLGTDPRCSMLRNTATKITNFSEHVCSARDCNRWGVWSTWSSCVNSPTRNRYRICSVQSTICSKHIKKTATQSCDPFFSQSQMILGICVGTVIIIFISVVVILGIKLHSDREKKEAVPNPLHVSKLSSQLKRPAIATVSGIGVTFPTSIARTVCPDRPLPRIPSHHQQLVRMSDSD